MRKTILIADDEKRAREGLGKILKKEGYDILQAKDGEEAAKLIRTKEIDLIMTDLKMPKVDGLKLLSVAKSHQPDAGYIVITAYGSIELAVEAIKQGANDFISKPIHIDQLKVVIKKTFQQLNLIQENNLLKEKLEEKFGLEYLIGSGPKMRAVFQFIKQVAPSRATVLIQGESGTGKELVANAIHYNSPRKSKPFIKLSCSSLSEGVLESELFGHEKGAFTGAIVQRKGRFELADGGSLFLDEIGDLSYQTQVKLLRFLQEREFERVGGNQPVKVDVRLIAATNIDLKKAVEENRFREDLYFRLNVVSITLPPLRDRPEDITLLVDHFVRKYSQENNKRIRGISLKALNLLKRYEWRGNVRELENCIENAVIMTTVSILQPKNLPAQIYQPYEGKEQLTIPIGLKLEEVEKKLIFKTLDMVNGNKTRAAEILGIGVRTIHHKIRQYQKG